MAFVIPHCAHEPKKPGTRLCLVCFKLRMEEIDARAVAGVLSDIRRSEQPFEEGEDDNEDYS